MTTITRHYVVVDGRLVHYRRAGHGPLLLLLHQSPQSSLDYVDLMQRWGERFTMIAPDRPGCGQSEPLPQAAPSFDDYADATAAFLDALHIGRVPIYGFHTGASEGITVAARHPRKVLAVAANGVSHMTADELAEIDAHYLPKIEPRWDGGHLTWLWGRMREQTVFFPWFKRSAAGRMDYDMAPPERTQRHLLEVLRNWRWYDVAYRAAFHADARASARDAAVPILVTAAAGDPLHAHIARLGISRPGLELRGQATPAETEAAASDYLLHAIRAQAAAERAAAPAEGPAFAASVGRTGRGFLGAPGQQLHALARTPASGNGRGRLVVLHDATASAATLEPVLAAAAAAGWAVTAPDLPGHGESVALGMPEARQPERARLVEVLAAQVAEALKTLPGSGPVTLLGLGAGASVALAIAAHAGGSAPFEIRQVVAWQPSSWPVDERAAIVEAFAEAPTVAWHGGQMAHAWIRANDAGLFHPWCLRRRGFAWRGAPRVEPLEVHERAIALLLSAAAGPALAAAVAAEEFRTRVDAARAPVQVLVDAASPQRYLDALHATLGGSRASVQALDCADEAQAGLTLPRKAIASISA